MQQFSNEECSTVVYYFQETTFPLLTLSDLLSISVNFPVFLLYPTIIMTQFPTKNTNYNYDPKVSQKIE